MDVTSAQLGMPTLSPCHCGRLRAGQKGHRKGARWCGPSRGWTAGPLAGPGSWGQVRTLRGGHRAVSRGGGGLGRVHAAPSSPCGCWMSASEEGRLRASGSRLCLWGQVGSLGAGRRPVTGGSWARTMRSGVFGSGCGPGQAPPPGALGPRLWREAPLPLAFWALCPLSWAGGRGQGPERAVRMWKAPGGQGLDRRSPRVPHPRCIPGQRSPSWDCSPAGISSSLSAEAPRGARGMCVCVCAVHDGSGLCMCG